MLCVSNDNATQTLTRHTCRVLCWETVGAITIRHERERGLQALCLLHRAVLGIMWRASTVADHVVLLIQQHRLSETTRPNTCRVGRVPLSWVRRAGEARLGGSMTDCSGFMVVLALRESPLVECCFPSLLIGMFILRPFACLCMSTALFAWRRPGQFQTGGCHALIHLNRNTLMRAGSWQQEHSQKAVLTSLSETFG